MIGRGAATAGLLLAAVLLAACAQPRRPVAPPAPLPPGPPQEPAPPPTPEPPEYVDGLYRPDLRDGGPPGVPDISGIPEPIPVPEPRARYGNRSPYTVLGRSYRVLDRADGYVERGTASWYGNKFHGRPTSSFEPYDMYKFTAAHKTLPLPSYVRVTNLDNGKSVVVRVNDRGPFHDNRLIDLSYVAAAKLDMLHNGTAKVEVRALDGDSPDEPRPSAASSGRVFLQVGAFGLKDNAENVQRQLQDAGVRRVQMQRAEVAGTTVWRVRIGPLSRVSDIERARSKVRALGLGEPQTVSR